MKKNARTAALTALERCARDGAWSAAALDAVLRDFQLEPRDGALAARLFLGVLQNDQYLDHYIDLYCQSKTEPKLRQILRLGAYQLLFMDKIPPHAAVSETVELCRDAKLDRAASLVNAVLRRLAENRDALAPIPGQGSAEYLAIRYSHPLWLAQKLIAQKGYPFTEQFFSANNGNAGLCIQVNRLSVSSETYERALERQEIPFQRFDALPGCLELPGGKVTELPGFQEGLFYVQDRAARVAVEAAGTGEGMRILDACAAPGGKTCLMAERMGTSGRVYAWDVHPHRVELIRAAARRLGLENVRPVERDARKSADGLALSMDAVLVDAPCSGLGVIADKPDIKYRVNEKELDALPPLQSEILEACAQSVRVGGLLVYATCTLLPAENGDVVRSFLKAHPGFEADPSNDWLPEALRPEFKNGMIQLLPTREGLEGFFIARMRRKGV